MDDILRKRRGPRVAEGGFRDWGFGVLGLRSGGFWSLGGFSRVLWYLGCCRMGFRGLWLRGDGK